MKIDVVPLPRMLTDEHVRDRAVVVFDVLRATTTITAALANGAKEIRVFDSLDVARTAATGFEGPKLLCGESKCLAPHGFDLGNSPGSYATELVTGRTLFLSTSNGTRALVAAGKANLLLAGAIVNASAVARVMKERQLDVTLLCAGTDGEPAPEDELGAGAVIAHLANEPFVKLSGEAGVALAKFQLQNLQLEDVLKISLGGQNVIRAGLGQDIQFAAQLNVFNIVPVCDGVSMTIRAL